MATGLGSTRRTFLKQIGAVGVAASVFPQILPSRAWGAASANGKLNVAMIGCGGRSHQLLPQVLGAGENLVAVCDVDARQIGKLKQEGKKKQQGVSGAVEKAKVYDDYRKLLEDKSIDAVVIAAGQRWHTLISKAAMAAGKHVFCEKPLAHSVGEARELRELGRQTKLVTQVGSQGGATESFRRSMELIQAGVLGQIREVHSWVNRGAPVSQLVATKADPIPEGLNWDFWCGPSRVLPFKNYYLGSCLTWGCWLDFGDGHLADMGAHGLNLPWRALKLGAPQRVSVEIPEPLKDSYPSSTKFRWDFAAREGMDAVTVWWHDGAHAAPPKPLVEELRATYEKVPNNGVIFVGEKGLLRSDAWGVGGVMKMNGEKRFRGVRDHDAGKAVPMTVPRLKNVSHMEEWINACKGTGTTFQPFSSAACVAEIAMTGILAMRLGQPIEWDSEALKVKGNAEADRWIHRETRTKWL